MRVSVTTVTEAILDIMRAATPGGTVDHALASRLGGEIRPAIEKAVRGRVTSGAELAAMSEFRTILHQHLGNPKTPYVESEARRAMQRTLETANRTSAEFSSLIAQAGTQLLRGAAGAAREAGEGRGTSERVSTAALTRDAPLSVNGAIGFAKELGVSPSYAGFFAGGSAEMRDALRGAITDGRAIAEDQIKSMKDVGMIMGAIRAGKLKADDPRIPESVKKVIGEMKDKGIDPATADPKVIKQYLKENPKALETARKEMSADVSARAGVSRDTIDAERRKLVELRSKNGAGGKTAAKPAASSTL